MSTSLLLCAAIFILLITAPVTVWVLFYLFIGYARH